MKSSNQIAWISQLRIIATFSVILLHVASTTLYHFSPGDNFDWWVGNIYDSLVRFSVPIFLMITGALLLGKDVSIIVFFRKKITRIILPFIFWTGIYILYNFLDQENSLKKPDELSNINWVIFQFQNGSSYHLWYIYMLISLYPTIPFFNLFLKKIPHFITPTLVLIWLIFIMMFSKDLSITNYEFSIKYIFGYFGYILLGYYLTTFSFGKIAERFTGAFIFILGLFITIFGTYFSSLEIGGFDKYFYSYLTPNVLLMATGIFFLFKNVNYDQLTAGNKIQARFNKHSYGIYLSHILVLNILANFGIDWFLINSIIGILTTTILCFIISFIIIWSLSKIPYGKYFIG